MAKDHYKNGREAAIFSLNAMVRDGKTRKEASSYLFELSSGEHNTTEAENQFDAGVRAQLEDLGFTED